VSEPMTDVEAVEAVKELAESFRLAASDEDGDGFTRDHCTGRSVALASVLRQLADARAELARERERGDRAERDAANLHRLACGAIWQGYDTTRVPSAAEIFTDCQDAWTEDPPEVVKTGIFVFLVNDPQAGQKGGGA
jgi:hypothetical protein